MSFHLSSSLVRIRPIASASGIVLAVGLAACSDAPTAPRRTIDPVAAASVMPAVADARLRLAGAIENISIRDRIAHDIAELETALGVGDGEKARFHARLIGGLLRDYRSQQSGTTDGADVTAIMLMVQAVSHVVAAGFDLP